MQAGPNHIFFRLVIYLFAHLTSVHPPPQPSIFDSNVRFRGHFGPLWASFWSFLGPKWAREPQTARGGRPKLDKRVGPHGSRVLIFSLLCTEKWAKWGVKCGVKWGVTMLKKRFLGLPRNVLKCHPNGLKRCHSTAAFGGRGAFGAAPVAVAANGGQITHPQK